MLHTHSNNATTALTLRAEHRATDPHNDVVQQTPDLKHAMESFAKFLTSQALPRFPAAEDGLSLSYVT
jgi:hypothetical protein